MWLSHENFGNFKVSLASFFKIYKYLSLQNKESQSMQVGLVIKSIIVGLG